MLLKNSGRAVTLKTSRSSTQVYKLSVWSQQTLAITTELKDHRNYTCPLTNIHYEMNEGVIVPSLSFAATYELLPVVWTLRLLPLSQVAGDFRRGE